MKGKNPLQVLRTPILFIFLAFWLIWFCWWRRNSCDPLACCFLVRNSIGLISKTTLSTKESIPMYFRPFIQKVIQLVLSYNSGYTIFRGQFQFLLSWFLNTSSPLLLKSRSDLGLDTLNILVQDCTILFHDPYVKNVLDINQDERLPISCYWNFPGHCYLAK